MELTCYSLLVYYWSLVHLLVGWLLSCGKYQWVLITNWGNILTKVGEFIDCVIGSKEYKGKEKWEVIDFFILGFFGFFGIVLLGLMSDLSCVTNNYYHDNCNSIRNTIQFFEGLI